MSNQKPSVPKGTRDFGPEQMGKRTYILDTIKTVFQTFGFQPLETPSIEELSTLQGKYGEEGDKLLYRIRSNKNLKELVKSKMPKEHFESLERAYPGWIPRASDLGLRYDLTVPFARYVVMNQHEITFPFRRYQVQPVWRADRPQKGRYREFYQCDADVVGTDSLICEAEIIMMLEEVFSQLKLGDYTIKINDRRLLHGLVEVLGAQGKETDLLVAIDKLDKIGEEKVLDELRERGFEEAAITKIRPLLRLSGSNEEQLATLSDLLADSTVGQAGITALREVMTLAQSLGSSLEHLTFDITLARGLSYYTGAIFEVKANQGSLTSSISGGGRYDNLTGVFGLPGVSGVGISFGVDRIYDVLDELNLFPEKSTVGTQVLFINFDRETERQVLPLVSQVRQAGIAAELYPEPVKLKKQFTYADKKNIPYAVVIGTNELASEQYSLKNLRTGDAGSTVVVGDY